MARQLWQVGNCYVLALACFAKRPEIIEEVQNRINNIGAILAKDLGITIEEAMQLPDSCELTPNAEEAFNKMNNWLSGPNPQPSIHSTKEN